MKIAFSSCPNDTFLFHAFVNKLVDHPFELDVQLADIQELNNTALSSGPDLCKVSFFTLGKILKDYCLLPVGSALGHSNGPKLLARRPFDLDDLRNGTIAIPGRDTTAYLLYRLLLPEAKVHKFCRFDGIPSLLTKWSDYGLMIHESRSQEAIQKAGLYEVCDLGALWMQKTGLALPLGCLVAKRSLGSETLTKLTESLTASLDHARQHPSLSQAYVLQHSQEKDPATIQAHIDLYVNEETRCLSAKGQEAILRLLEEAHRIGLLNDFVPSEIFANVAKSNRQTLARKASRPAEESLA